MALNTNRPEHDPEIIVERSSNPFLVCVKDGRATDRFYPKTAKESNDMVKFHREQNRAAYWLVRDARTVSGWRYPGVNEFSLE